MGKIIIAVGSARLVKMNAVSAALRSFGSFLNASSEFEIEGIDVPSGVRHTPLTREDTMTGARQRAEALLNVAREKNAPWEYFVGLEGGLDVVRDGSARLVFLENWAYVADRSRLGFFGQSGAVPLPDTLVRSVVDQGVELSEAIDAFAGSHGIRDAQGAWGILTHNLITRQDAFQAAVINAFAPFFNSEIYSQHFKRGIS
jgi:inosine/xanthosine triphosphatase